MVLSFSTSNHWQMFEVLRKILFFSHIFFIFYEQQFAHSFSKHFQLQFFNKTILMIAFVVLLTAELELKKTFYFPETTK